MSDDEDEEMGVEVVLVDAVEREDEEADSGPPKSKRARKMKSNESNVIIEADDNGESTITQCINSTTWQKNDIESASLRENNFAEVLEPKRSMYLPKKS